MTQGSSLVRGEVLSGKDLSKWTGGHGKRLTHDLFRFPGEFHPPIVEHILDVTRPNAIVDPMAGVGTVAVEARAAVSLTLGGHRPR